MRERGASDCPGPGSGSTNGHILSMVTPNRGTARQVITTMRSMCHDRRSTLYLGTSLGASTYGRVGEARGCGILTIPWCHSFELRHFLTLVKIQTTYLEE